MNTTKILDCTLRDGGYYTNWNFDDFLVDTYAEAMEALPIDYVEVGYRSTPQKGYLGQYFYCPDYVLKKLKELIPTKKLSIILNEKDIRSFHVTEGLLDPCKPYISLVRIAVDPKHMKRAIKLAKEVKKSGFKVAFNVMYMSNWKTDSSFLNYLEGVDNIIDYFYMVDSYGGVMPEDVKETISLIKTKTNIPLGFHGHNNLEMALINTITAIDLGCEIVDATVTGMGRGAGNLKTELLLTFLENAKELPIKYRQLSKVVSEFEELRKRHQWGTSLPYMFSGAKSLPQKQVMEWVGMNRYPLGTILNALNNQKQEVEDNLKFPVLEKEKKHKQAIILGGGQSSRAHKKAIQKLFEYTKTKSCLVHAGVRNVSEFLDVDCDQYYALVGFESDKLLGHFKGVSNINRTLVYPPYPRPMGTTLPPEILELVKELEAISFTEVSTDSPMALAIQTALDLGATEIFLVGFDGYDTSINHNQFVLARENQEVINDAIIIADVDVKSLTPTKYKNIEVLSIYSLL